MVRRRESKPHHVRHPAKREPRGASKALVFSCGRYRYIDFHNYTRDFQIMQHRSVAFFFVVLAATALGGCAIHQNVKPVGQFSGKEICVIDNPAVRAGFAQSYRRALTSKGYLVKQLPASAPITECSIASTYTANWRWDMATYMAYAEIKVFNNGKPAGQAIYDAMNGGGNMAKFIEADKKIEELVNQLFPGGAGS
jgi:hypothetical protein